MPLSTSAGVLRSLIGFLRWVFVVPPLAHAYVTGDATTRAAVDAAWMAQHRLGGALLGEHAAGLVLSAIYFHYLLPYRAAAPGPRPAGVPVEATL